MKHIFLLRHAKTVRQVAADESDFDRPLTPRGVRACAIMGQFLRDQGIETVLCSPAARTRETLGRLAPHAGWDIARGRPAVRYDRGIYLASAGRIIALVRATDDRIERLLVVGHNPAMEEAALQLQGRADDAAALVALQRKLPTAGLAHLVFADTQWNILRRGGAVLHRVVTPRLLAGEDGD